MSRGYPAVRALLLGTNVLLGIALVAGGLLATGAAWQVRLVLVLYGLCWLATLPIVARSWWGVRPTGERVQTAGGATVVGYDPSPARGGAFVCGWLTAVTALAGLLGLAAGAIAGGVLGLLLAGFFALPLTDLLLALRRGAWLSLTRQRIVVRGWRTESSLDWADVAGVEVVRSDRRPHLLIRAAVGSTSWQGRQLPRAWPARSHLEPGLLLVDAAAVEPHTALLYEAMQRWTRDPSTRTDLGTAEAERELHPAGQSA
ncbi:hypothetical protein [Nocardioides mangrovi]|uniref:PH domain-containing protein n=1 Tax=Nocardioides mangrovi TaxID=2874580 RepID=A0ABS7UCD0_9ACTN|nr:hypothetical protein [Nocardioides mangrovi]MBZ5738297.1 hypothetical protein [Nocardioides mangrovi]